MRTEKEMFDLIIGVAQNDDRIRAVYMNGSRTNKNAPKDIFQDYDVVYVVTETKSFQNDKSWIDIFGEQLYMQMPEETGIMLGLCDSDIDKSYGWLIQFADGNRLDLHVNELEFAKESILDDKLCEILLDKDNVLPKLDKSTDKDYWIKKPNEAKFLAVCNEFWWSLNNVAKGLWRQEIPYVLDMLNLYIRTELIEMLSWQIGIKTDFSVSVGKSGKYMYKWLSKDVWENFLQTYCGANVEGIWQAVFTMCDLFDEIARKVSQQLGYTYNIQEAKNSRAWLEQVKKLDSDAQNIYI